MIRKNFLSGIFSVVSFILVSNLVIPSTFALCPPDVSGKWVVTGVDVVECCSDKGGKSKESFVVTQVGDTISASWTTDDESAVLTGIVNGNSVYGEVVGTDLEHPECVWVTHIVGIIKGNRITGYYTAAKTCNACRSHSKFKVKIVK